MTDYESPDAQTPSINSQNYFESVVVPVLQKKCQDLFNINMVLEANLQIELAKSRECSEEILKLKSLVAGSEVLKAQLASTNVQLTNVTNELTTSRNELAAARSELGQAKVNAEDMANKVSQSNSTTSFMDSDLRAARQQIAILQEEYLSLKEELAKAKEELNSARLDTSKPAPVVKPSTRQPKAKTVNAEANTY
jgi:chromosome segregation ATPase